MKWISRPQNTFFVAATVHVETQYLAHSLLKAIDDGRKEPQIETDHRPLE